jgi:manganese transport protein
VSAASFNDHKEDVADLRDAYYLLRTHFGPAAGIAFAFALLLSGQSSTITGTLAGQVVTEGFLGPSYKFSPWVQRLSTRTLAILPAMCVAIWYGEPGMNGLLVGSQVILSLQLPFAVWPLVWITSDSNKMSVKFESEDGIVDGEFLLDFLLHVLCDTDIS